MSFELSCGSFDSQINRTLTQSVNAFARWFTSGSNPNGMNSNEKYAFYASRLRTGKKKKKKDQLHSEIKATAMALMSANKCIETGPKLTGLMPNLKERPLSVYEKKFLLCAERGDTVSIKKLLAEHPVS